MKKRGLAAIVLTGIVAVGTFGFNVPAGATEASAADNSADYTITIPSELKVSKIGWNATDGIQATGVAFDSDKKLIVTAESQNNIAGKGWALAAEDDNTNNNTIGYNLVTNETAYNTAAQPASWKFSGDEVKASARKDMGIVVEDYTKKNLPAGTYTDTVDFTVKVLTYLKIEKPQSNDNTVEYLDDVKFYYFPGETYREAKDHEENSKWNIYTGKNEVNEIVEVTINMSATNYSLGNMFIDGDDNFAEGKHRDDQHQCSLTLDSKIESNHTYTHNITKIKAQQ